MENVRDIKSTDNQSFRRHRNWFESILLVNNKQYRDYVLRLLYGSPTHINNEP